MSEPTPSGSGRLLTVFLATAMSVAVVGYFVGLSDGVPLPEGIVPDETALTAVPDPQPTEKVVPAVAYAEISETAMGPTAAFKAAPAMLPKQEAYDLFTKVIPSEAEKLASTKVRASRRAFNGAPPIIPHGVQNSNDASCYACHGGGLKIAGMKASVMSHEYLANCTQCHAPPPPTPFQDVDASVNTSFVGLPAPLKGKRAFPGAPPTIPHSQWMREKCEACHGGPNGWAGMESTHPWRTNCTQCHAPSAKLDQAIPAAVPPMLPPLEVVAN